MFSGSVMLGSLDDFITPSQACVNPLFTDPSTSGKGSSRLPASAGKSGVGTPVPGGTAAPAAAKVSIVSDFDSFEASFANRPDLIKPVRSSKGAISLSLDDANETDCKVDTRSTARVTLNDCLACSGCVTSAETVLIQQQSASEFQAAVSRPTTSAVLISFAPQALASLAAHLGLHNTAEAYQRLTTFFRWQVQEWASSREQPLPVFVCDTVLASDLILQEAGREFMGRVAFSVARSAAVAQAGSVVSGPCDTGRAAWTAPQPSIAVSALAQRRVGHLGAVLPEEPVPRLAAAAAAAVGDMAASVRLPSEAAGDMAASVRAALPVLTSACPGWVCYAEKTVPESLPYVSTLKSPQQVTGALAKLMLAKGGVLQPGASSEGQTPGRGTGVLGPLHPAGVYHVSIMPCYDRKLEASRRDFWWEREGLLGYVNEAGTAEGEAEGESWKEVDCVLSSLEVAELLQSHMQGLAAQAADLSVGGRQTARPTAVVAVSGERVMDVYPPTQRVGLVYSPDGARAEQEHMDVEALLCSLKTVRCGSNSSVVLVGAANHHVESDGYAASIVRYMVGELRGTAAALCAALDTPVANQAGETGVAQWLHGLLSPAALEPGLPASLLDPACPLPLSTGRNSDMKEYTLRVPLPLLLAWHAHNNQQQQQQQQAAEGAGAGSMPAVLEQLSSLHPSLRSVSVPLSFAWAYGFRNIQGVVNKLKRAGGRGPLTSLPPPTSTSGAPTSVSASFPYAYVEVMACPGGCTNGGGQVRVAEGEGERRAEGAVDRAGTAAEGDVEAKLASTSSGSSSRKKVNVLKAAADASKARLAHVAQLNAGCVPCCGGAAACDSAGTTGCCSAAASDRLSSPAQTEQALLRLVPWLADPSSTSASALRPHPQLWSHLLHTQYHAVPPLVEGAGGGFSGSALKW